MIHQKKIESEYFNQIIEGTKPYEVRINDCNYRKGDFIGLNEIDEKGKETGEFILVMIAAILDDPRYTKENYVIMTIAPCTIEVGEIGATCAWYGERKEEVA